MKQLPKASIHLTQAIALYIGAVLGAGILIVPGLAADIAGPASLIDWLFLMIFVLPLALCMAYLSEKYPGSGGVSYFVTKALGKRMGIITGWFFLMSVPIGAPVAALTGASYLSAAFRLPGNMTVVTACLVLLLALLLNYFGMTLAGSVQVIVVSGILSILGLAIVGSVSHIDIDQFKPFMPQGILSIGKASTLLFWCFIGWEAVANLSGEFIHPEKDVRRATVISAFILGGIYFLTAFAVIGTGSYQEQSEAALVNVAEKGLGWVGADLIGIAGLLICLATVITYVGAASRLACSLSDHGDAWKWLGRRSARFQTPLGGLLFLFACFVCVIFLYTFRLISLTTLIQLPNATFLLNYIGGCAAGIVLFRKEKKKRLISMVSLMVTLIMFLFVGWAAVYPLAILLAIASKKMAVKLKTFLSRR